MSDLDVSTKHLALQNNAQYDKTLASLKALKDKPGALSDKELAQLKKTAQDFESIFLTMILKNMRQAIPKSDLFGEGMAGEVYSGMFDERIAQVVASKGGIHLSDTIVDSITGNRGSQSSGLKLEDYWRQPIKRLEQQGSKEWDHKIISQAAGKYNLDPKLIEAVIKVESDYQPNLVSSKGAVGLMQLMPGTARDLGVQNRYNPRQNVFGGANYLRQMLDRFDGNTKLALGAYNAGPGAVEKYGGIPPYRETQRYVEKVLKHYHQ